MKFYSVNWSTYRPGQTPHGVPAAASWLPTEMDVACDCGHRWHAVRGKNVGDISNGVRSEVTCPSCGAVDSYQYQLPISA